MADSLRDLFGTGDPDEYRKKLAAALVSQGVDASAIRSPWQGAARLAQALTGGMMMNDLASSANQDRIDQATALRGGIGLPPMSGTPLAPPAAFQPPTQNPPSNSQMPVTPPMSGGSYNGPGVKLPPNMIGYDEGVRMGIYEPDKPVGAGRPSPQPAAQGSPPVSQPGIAPQMAPQPQQVAQAAPQGQGGLRQVPAMPPEVMERIDRLTRLGTKSGLQQAQLIADTYQKKALDQVRPLTDPAERARMGIPPTDTNPYQIDATGKMTAVNPQPFAVNVNQQGQSEFEKNYGEGMSKRALAVLKAGDDASVDIQNTQLMRGLLSNIKSGKLSPVGATIGSWMQSAGLDPKNFGIDPNLPASAEAITALSNKMTLGNIGGEGGMPANNFSNTDREFLNKITPSIANRPEANDILLDVAERTAQLKIMKADRWSEARANGKSYEEFERGWRKELGSKNIFGDLAQKAAALGGQGQGGGNATQPAPTSPPTREEILQELRRRGKL